MGLIVLYFPGRAPRWTLDVPNLEIPVPEALRFRGWRAMFQRLARNVPTCFVASGARFPTCFGLALHKTKLFGFTSGFLQRARCAGGV